MHIFCLYKIKIYLRYKKRIKSMNSHVVLVDYISLKRNEFRLNLPIASRMHKIGHPRIKSPIKPAMYSCQIRKVFSELYCYYFFLQETEFLGMSFYFKTLTNCEIVRKFS